MAEGRIGTEFAGKYAVTNTIYIMKRLLFSLMIAAIALLPTACDPEPLPNTPDLTGTLYGTWVLDTKTVDIVTTQDGKTNSDYSSTDFTGDHFLLHLTDFMVAFAQEGTVITFDIDDVDGAKYSYNADLHQISFEKILSLSKGFLNPKIMTLFGKYDILILSDSQFVIKKEETTTLGSRSTTTTTVYSFHRLTDK